MQGQLHREVTFELGPGDSISVCQAQNREHSSEWVGQREWKHSGAQSSSFKEEQEKFGEAGAKVWGGEETGRAGAGRVPEFKVGSWILF